MVFSFFWKSLITTRLHQTWGCGWGQPSPPRREEKCIKQACSTSRQCGTLTTPSQLSRTISGSGPYPLKPHLPESSPSGGFVRFVGLQVLFTRSGSKAFFANLAGFAIALLVGYLVSCTICWLSRFWCVYTPGSLRSLSAVHFLVSRSGAQIRIAISLRGVVCRLSPLLLFLLSLFRWRWRFEL